MQREKFCNNCEFPNELFGTGLVLNKYDVRFFRCPACGFIQTETPYWLEEAYSKAIASSHIGYVSRNVRMARVTRALISLAFAANKRFVDSGGGYGMFVRLTIYGTVTAFVNIALSIILVQRWGLNGVVFASVVPVGLLSYIRIFWEAKSTLQTVAASS